MSKRNFYYYYFLDLLIKKITKNTTKAIPITPVQIPALKTPPMAAQPVKVVIKKIIAIAKENDKLRIKLILIFYKLSIIIFFHLASELFSFTEYDINMERFFL